MAECDKIPEYITDGENVDNTISEKEGMPTSKQLLYSEYFDKSDVFEKSILNLRKAPPVFQNFGASGVLSKVKQFVTVMEKAETDLKLKSPHEYNIELEENGESKPAIEFNFELYKKDNNESDDEANVPSLQTLSEDDGSGDDENCKKAKKIIEMINSDSSDCDSDDESVRNDQSNTHAKLENDSDSESTSSRDDFMLPQRKHQRTDNA